MDKIKKALLYGAVFVGGAITGYGLSKIGAKKKCSNNDPQEDFEEVD